VLHRMSGSGQCVPAEIIYFVPEPFGNERSEDIFADGCFWCLRPGKACLKLLTVTGAGGQHEPNPCDDDII